MFDLEYLYLFGGEAVFAFIVLLLRLFGKHKTAEQLKAKKEKKVNAILSKASKLTTKANTIIENSCNEKKE